VADEARVDRLALRPAEAAAALGISVRRLRQIKHEIPHVRRGDTLLFPVPELRAWLSENARTAVETAGTAPVVPEEADSDAVVREILERLK
jgi:hypothetical protein